MAGIRHTFGGGASDFAYALATVGGTGNVVVTPGGASLQCWSAASGNFPITDLLLNSNPVTSIPIPAGGQYPQFQGPVGTYGMWVSVGGGPRVWVVANDPDGLVSDVVANGALTPGVLGATYSAIPAHTAAGMLSTQQLANGNAVAMRPWQAALSNRDNAPAHLMVVGDSISEGQGATTFPRTWVRRLAPILNKRRPIVVGAQPVGGRGFMCAFHGGLTGITPVNEGVTQVGGTAVYGSGLGVNLQAAVLNASGNTLTYPLVGDKVQISFAGGSGQGKFSWAVDGGAATTIDASTYPLTYADVTALIPLGAAGAHTLVLTWVSGATYHNGVVEYNGDSASGIVVHNAALGGQDAIYYNGQTTNSGYATFTHAAYMGVSCIVVMVGINAANSANRTPAQFQGDLTTLLSYIRSIYAFIAPSTPLPTVVLVPEYKPSTITVGGATWPQYVAAVYAAAATDVNACVGPDFSMRFPANAGAAAPWFSDGFHPTDAGHAYIADTMADFLVGNR